MVNYFQRTQRASFLILISGLLVLLFSACQSEKTKEQSQRPAFSRKDFQVEKVGEIKQQDLDLFRMDEEVRAVAGYFSLAVHDSANIALARSGGSSFMRFDKKGTFLHKVDLDSVFHIRKMRFLDKDTMLLNNGEESQILKWTPSLLTRHQFEWPEDWWAIQGGKLAELVDGASFMREYYDQRMSEAPLTRFNYAMALYAPENDSLVYELGPQMLIRYRLGKRQLLPDHIFINAYFSAIGKELLYVDPQERYAIIYTEQGNLVEALSLPSGSLMWDFRSDFPLGSVHSNFSMDADGKAIWFVSDLPLAKAPSDEDSESPQPHSISIFRIHVAGAF